MKLWILRHARAEADSLTGRDRDRPLAAAGRTACNHLNAWIRDSGRDLPAQIRVSPARRTIETAELVLAGLKSPALTRDESLWSATTGDLLKLIEQARGNELMLIGHNPGLEEVLRFLGAALPPTGLKPGTLVILEVERPPGRGPAVTDQVVAPIESI